MPFDLRTPIGWLFAAYGVLLVVRGATGQPVKSLGLNINLIWGAFLLVFGLGLLLFVRLKKHR